MSGRRVGAARVTQTPAALTVESPALRAAGPALLLALFGAACVVIALAATLGLFPAGGDAGAARLALAFAGVLVLPLCALGLLFAGVGLWTLGNALTATVTPAGIAVARRCCGLPLVQGRLAAADVVALDCLREARFHGIVGGARRYRLRARSARGALTIADHLPADAAGELLGCVIAALARPQLAGTGRREHEADA